MLVRALLAGLPTLVLCVALQALFVSLALKCYDRMRPRAGARLTQWRSVKLLSAIMMLMLLGNFLQMGLWAFLFRLLGEFADFPSSLYHSAVNFTTLGYGDVVMSPRWRLLGALEAANGILMFGVSTAVMTAAVIEMLRLEARSRNDDAK
ncbi:potassium channel family protein [Noviluteimonas gilva]|uniref:Two pore domain potassium channel family protein n=1 Tax=Noviluteimonas gilva TaxID=2682097 RepID=A0A7C9HLH3_9GAMM|nr:potassium channel family protein [Lysobacter gilvus]MUV13690.1 two pore domain potassium channel family protein [Lysobacter gilvus]